MKLIRIVIISLFSISSLHASQINESFFSAGIQSVKDHPSIVAACFAGSIAGWYIYDSYTNHIPLYWDWNEIDTNDVQFPEHFLWGSATSAPQIEGGSTNSNWTMWEQQQTSESLIPSGIACDHWNRYTEDAQLAQQAGLNALGISLSWDKIEPKEGEFNLEAIEHYIDVCKTFRAHNLQPIVCFHFYTHPQWFEEKGAFEREENISYFVRFCSKMFEALDADVFQWLTFTNPTSYCIKGYLEGMMTPGVRNIQRMQTVLKNMLEAHTKVYRTCKTKNPNAQIGIKHTQFIVEPWNPYNPLDRLAARMAFNLFSNNVYTYFTTGTFKTYIPKYVNVYHHNPEGRGALDFIVSCYYSHGFIKNFKAVRNPDELAIDNHPLYSVYPEGLYRAIKELDDYVAQPLGIPIYVSGNGIGTCNPEVRKTFGTRNIYALSRAIADGYPVKGYWPWTFMDNYEWGTFDKQYGLYYVDRDNDLKRVLRTDHYYYQLLQRFSNQPTRTTTTTT